MNEQLNEQMISCFCRTGIGPQLMDSAHALHGPSGAQCWVALIEALNLPGVCRAVSVTQGQTFCSSSFSHFLGELEGRHASSRPPEPWAALMLSFGKAVPLGQVGACLLGSELSAWERPVYSKEQQYTRTTPPPPTARRGVRASSCPFLVLIIFRCSSALGRAG